MKWWRDVCVIFLEPLAFGHGPWETWPWKERLADWSTNHYIYIYIYLLYRVFLESVLGIYKRMQMLCGLLFRLCAWPFVWFLGGWGLLVSLGAHSVERVLEMAVWGATPLDFAQDPLKYSYCSSSPLLNARLTLLKVLLLKCVHIVWNLFEGLWRFNNSLWPKPSASICSFYNVHSAKLPPLPPHCLIVPLESTPWHWGCNCQVNLIIWHACRETNTRRESKGEEEEEEEG